MAYRPGTPQYKKWMANKRATLAGQAADRKASQSMWNLSYGNATTAANKQIAQTQAEQARAMQLNPWSDWQNAQMTQQANTGFSNSTIGQEAMSRDRARYQTSVIDPYTSAISRTQQGLADVGGQQGNQAAVWYNQLQNARQGRSDALGQAWRDYTLRKWQLQQGNRLAEQELTSAPSYSREPYPRGTAYGIGLGDPKLPSWNNPGPNVKTGKQQNFETSLAQQITLAKMAEDAAAARQAAEFTYNTNRDTRLLGVQQGAASEKDYESKLAALFAWAKENPTAPTTFVHALGLSLYDPRVRAILSPGQNKWLGGPGGQPAPAAAPAAAPAVDPWSASIPGQTPLTAAAAWSKANLPQPTWYEYAVPTTMLARPLEAAWNWLNRPMTPAIPSATNR